VAREIQRNLGAWERVVVRRRVDARLLANAAIAARSQDSTGYLPYLLRSIAAFPFPGLGQRRCRLLAVTLLERLTGKD
jgi:hypothetical protein